MYVSHSQQGLVLYVLSGVMHSACVFLSPLGGVGELGLCCTIHSLPGDSYAMGEENLLC